MRTDIQSGNLHITTSLADTKRTNKYFDAKLATTSTGRNQRTVLALAEPAARSREMRRKSDA